MHRVAVGFVVWLVPLVLAPSSTGAKTMSDFPQDAIVGATGRLNVRSGLLLTIHRTAARVDSETLGQGTLVDVERELGLDGRTRDLRLDAALVLGRRHQIQAGYLSLSRNGRVALQRRIRCECRCSRCLRRRSRIGGVSASSSGCRRYAGADATTVRHRRAQILRGRDRGYRRFVEGVTARHWSSTR